MMAKNDVNSAESHLTVAAHRAHHSRWPVVELASVAAGGVAGLMGSMVAISRHFYKNMKERGVFSEPEAARNAAYVEAMKNEVDGTVATLRKIEKRIVGNYEAAVDENIKRVGVHNIMDKWGSLKSHQKWETGLSAFTIAAVTLGAVFSMGRHMQNQQQQAISDELSSRQNCANR